MKRYGNLWGLVTSRENIIEAIDRASKHKRKRKSVIKVLNNKEHYVDLIQDMLLNDTYKVSAYNIRAIYEPKLRLIYVLPFFPDNIIFHCLMNILEIIWEEFFIYDSYSCRKGKGQHKGFDRSTHFVRRYKYCLKCDISQFYPSISHEIIKDIFKRKIKDLKVLNLLNKIVDSIATRENNLKFLKNCKARDKINMENKLLFLKSLFPNGNYGVPIGNYPSQWFGNLFLNDLDMYVKHTLKIKAYVRYCDDFVIYSDSKQELREYSIKIKNFIYSHLNMYLSKCRIFPTSQGVDFLGYKAFSFGKVLIRKRIAKQSKKQIEDLWYNYSKYDKMKMLSIVGSRIGYLKKANSYNFMSDLNLAGLNIKIRRDIRKGVI